MKKAGKKLMAAAGMIMMLVIIIVFGFMETNIPAIVYLGMWGICAGAVSYGTGAQLVI